MVYDNEKIYIDSEGYKSLLAEIEELNRKLALNGVEKGEAYSGSAGDGWHDNFAFDEANMQERIILGQLRDLYDKKNRVVIIDKQEEEDIIDFNDIVTVNMIFGPDDSEEVQFKLVGYLGSNGDNLDIDKVSINSPLGKAVYHKRVGDRTNYKVGNNNFTVDILSRVLEEDYVNTMKKTR